MTPDDPLDLPANSSVLTLSAPQFGEANEYGLVLRLLVSPTESQISLHYPRFRFTSKERFPSYTSLKLAVADLSALPPEAFKPPDSVILGGEYKHTDLHWTLIHQEKRSSAVRGHATLFEILHSVLSLTCNPIHQELLEVVLSTYDSEGVRLRQIPSGCRWYGHSSQLELAHVHTIKQWPTSRLEPQTTVDCSNLKWNGCHDEALNLLIDIYQDALWLGESKLINTLLEKGVPEHQCKRMSRAYAWTKAKKT